mgnify:FL=1
MTPPALLWTERRRFIPAEGKIPPRLLSVGRYGILGQAKRKRVGGLSRSHEVRHVILYAEKKTLLRRLAYRLEGRRSWGARQIDRCLRAFDRDIPGVKLHTDRLSVEQAAERAAALAGLTLAEDRRSRPRRLLDRAAARIRHIR